MFSCFLALALAQEMPVAPPESTWKPKVTLSGRIGGYYAYREGALEESRGNLNSASGGLADTDFFSGRISVRLEAQVQPTIRGVIELSNKPYGAGSNHPFGQDAVEAFVEQGYAEVRSFLTPKLTFRAGIQDVKLNLRPHADSFFLDVAHAESFYSGAVFGATSSFVRTTADRDLSEAAGVKFLYDAEEFLTLHAFAGAVREAGAPSKDEGLFYAYGNLWIPETVSCFLLLALVSGPAHESQVFTLGLGANGYVKPWLEAFGESYYQFGSLDADTGKQAWGVQLGARAWMLSWFFEVAFAYRSGDEDALDGTDGSFQSYESSDQFLVVESADVGMDWDTNVRSLCFTVGVQSADLGGAFGNVTVRLDAALFHFNEELRSSTGSVLLGGSDDAIGNEIDLSVLWAYDEALTFQLRGGALFGSDVLEKLTASGDRSALALVMGGSLRF